MLNMYKYLTEQYQISYNTLMDMKEGKPVTKLSRSWRDLCLNEIKPDDRRSHLCWEAQIELHEQAENNFNSIDLSTLDEKDVNNLFWDLQEWLGRSSVVFGLFNKNEFTIKVVRNLIEEQFEVIEYVIDRLKKEAERIQCDLL